MGFLEGEHAPVLAPVFVGVGSNMGNRIHHLNFAVHELEKLAVGQSLRCSPVYETLPVGYTDQGNFLNMVVGFDTILSPKELLAALHDVEQRAGRKRTIRFGPRTLDLDILLYGDFEVAEEKLQIPHPRLVERAFVLFPLRDLAPECILPGGHSVTELAKVHVTEGGVRYVGRFW